MNNQTEKKLKNQKRRGKIHNEDLKPYINLSTKELTNMLKNNNAQKRTIAAKLLGCKNNPKTIKPLSKQLTHEKALYTRITICESLVKYEKKSIIPLINLLGKIGTNQEKKLPEKYFNKKSFPLPRDLAGRTLSRIGEKATPHLMEILDDKEKIHDNFIKEQAIDAIGAIAHKHNDHRALKSLISLSEKNENNNKIIQWKIVRALSGYKKNKTALKTAINILNKYYSIKNNNHSENTVEIQWETIRSIGQIGINNKEVNEILNSFEKNKNPQIQLALKITKKALLV